MNRNKMVGAIFLMCFVGCGPVMGPDAGTGGGQALPMDASAGGGSVGGGSVIENDAGTDSGISVVDAGCAPGRACPNACTLQSECAANEMCDNGYCFHPLPTSNSFSSCALDGDCPRGDYCNISVCKHDCVIDRDCATGTVCSIKGRCIVESMVNQPPPIVPPSKGFPVLSKSVLTFAKIASSQMVTLSNSGGEPFDFAVTSDNSAFSITPAQGRVSGQPLTITITLDPTRLDDRMNATISVASSAGLKTIGIAVNEPTEGTYAMVMSVSTPLMLGRHTAALSIKETAPNQYTGNVISARSPLWPGDPAITGTFESVSVGAGMMKTMLVLRFAVNGAAGSLGNPQIPNTIGRFVEIQMERTTTHIWSGTYFETLVGVAGNGVPTFGQPTPVGQEPPSGIGGPVVLTRV